MGKNYNDSSLSWMYFQVMKGMWPIYKVLRSHENMLKIDLKLSKPY
jgi:hypothetical protein